MLLIIGLTKPRNRRNGRYLPPLERAASRAGPDAKFGKNQLVRDKLVNLTGR